MITKTVIFNARQETFNYRFTCKTDRKRTMAVLKKTILTLLLLPFLFATLYFSTVSWKNEVVQIILHCIYLTTVVMLIIYIQNT